MDIVATRISGTLPPEYGDLQYLEMWGSEPMRLSGTIPPEYGNLVQPAAIAMLNTQLSGTIPSEFGRLTTLEALCATINRNPTPGVTTCGYSTVT